MDYYEEDPNTVSESTIMLDEFGRAHGVSIQIYISLESIKDQGISKLYDPIFDEVGRVEGQLTQLGYLEEKE